MRALRFTLVALFAVLSLSQSRSKEASIRDVEFKNFWFEWNHEMKKSPSYAPWRWLNPLPESKIHVVNGTHHFYEATQNASERIVAPLVSVESVVYGDVDGDGAEDAAVHLNYSTGGTLNWDYLYVYTGSASQPKLMGVLRAGSRADGGLYHAAIEKGLLVLDFADAERRMGDCCSAGYIRVRYRWVKGGFVEQGQREHGDWPPKSAN